MGKYQPDNLVNLTPSADGFKSALINNLESIGEVINNISNENVSNGASISWEKIDFTGSPYVRSDYFRRGTGTPEGSVIASVGTIYQRTDGGANTSIYVKESGTGNTGWVAK
jgi:hypothetical protein